MNLKPLPKKFFRKEVTELAKELLGHYLVREIDDDLLIGKIVETEAYDESEKACHAYGGKTDSNSLLFEPGGLAYIYFVYGIHWMMNITAGRKEVRGSGVLIRALEPIRGEKWMRGQRGVESGLEIASGPAKLTEAMRIDNALEGEKLFEKGNLWVAEAGDRDIEIETSKRIGVDYAEGDADLEWRFFIKENPHISKGA